MDSHARRDIDRDLAKILLYASPIARRNSIPVPTKPALTSPSSRSHFKFLQISSRSGRA